MKVGFIVSAGSGHGQYEKWLASLRKYYPKEAFHMTAGPGDVARLAGDFAAAGGERLVLLGGDGALSEAAGALTGKRTALSVIPTGTGNDFARQFNYRALDLRRISEAPVRPIDLMEVNGKISINITSLGFDTNALVYAYRLKKKWPALGQATFLYGAVKSLMKKEIVHLALSLKMAREDQNLSPDGEERIREGDCCGEEADFSAGSVHFEGDYFISALCNGAYYGSGFQPAPNARLDDGKINLVLVPPLPTRKVLSLFMAYRKGEHLNQPGIRELLVQSGSLSSDQPFLYNIDGEIYRGHRISFRILPRALRWAYLAPLLK